MIGSRIGPYEITAQLGEGGMGLVYRAKDFQLGREVALKVLPEGFAADPERLARFEREAKLLASLNHPNIAQIYGLETSGASPALVMELVEGPTLADRLAQGSLSLTESLSIARQIAEALEEAHEKGIVHRDLKPQNVKASIEGKVKVLDFGLAKAMEPIGAASSSASPADVARSPTLMNSPTLTAAGTQLGVILGTAAYMSPEQAKGAAVDERADIWAFGVVLWEMLTGRRLFSGDSVAETLAGVLRSEVDFGELSSEVPPAIRRLLRRCLERNPRNRLHSIADARIELAEATSSAGNAGELGEPGAGIAVRRRARWLPALLGVSALVLGLAAGRLARPRPEALPVVQASIPAPDGTELVPIGETAGAVTVSPDGGQLAFTAQDPGGVTRLYVQSLAAGTARVIAGSEGARYPFWSPDSRSIAFFNGKQLLRVGIGEGAPLALATSDFARGGAWGSKGIIVYAPTYSSGLMQIPAAGGSPEPATALDATRREGTHRFPHFLPDGRHFLYEVRGYNAWMRLEDGVFAGDVDDPAYRVRLLDFASNASYAAGRLLFVRNGDLCAQRFDPDRLELSGPVSILVRDVRFDRRFSLGVFSATSGVLALQHGAGQDANELDWLGRDGHLVARVEEAATHDGVVLSHDGGRAVISIVDPATSRSHLEVIDLRRGSSTRLTFGEADDYSPIWSPGDTEVLFARADARGIGLWIKPADGSAAERRFRAEKSDEFLIPLAWLPDGSRVLLTSLRGGSMPTGLWTLPASGEGELERYGDSRGNGDVGNFSPDGRWVLFDADEGTGARTYVARYPDTGGRWQLADDEAAWSSWTKGGRELVYQSVGTGLLTALPVDLSAASPQFGTPRPLFKLPQISIHGNSFSVSADGERVLALLPLAGARPVPYTLILHWERLLEAPR
jgi:Tol biopolymer transport system component